MSIQSLQFFFLNIFFSSFLLAKVFALSTTSLQRNPYQDFFTSIQEKLETATLIMTLDGKIKEQRNDPLPQKIILGNTEEERMPLCLLEPLQNDSFEVQTSQINFKFISNLLIEIPRKEVVALKAKTIAAFFAKLRTNLIPVIRKTLPQSVYALLHSFSEEYLYSIAICYRLKNGGIQKINKDSSHDEILKFQEVIDEEDGQFFIYYDTPFMGKENSESTELKKKDLKKIQSDLLKKNEKIRKKIRDQLAELSELQSSEKFKLYQTKEKETISSGKKILQIINKTVKPIDIDHSLLDKKTIDRLEFLKEQKQKTEKKINRFLKDHDYLEKKLREIVRQGKLFESEIMENIKKNRIALGELSNSTALVLQEKVSHGYTQNAETMLEHLVSNNETLEILNRKNAIYWNEIQKLLKNFEKNLEDLSLYTKDINRMLAEYEFFYSSIENIYAKNHVLVKKEEEKDFLKKMDPSMPEEKLDELLDLYNDFLSTLDQETDPKNLMAKNVRSLFSRHDKISSYYLFIYISLYLGMPSHVKSVSLKSFSLTIPSLSKEQRKIFENMWTKVKDKPLVRRYVAEIEVLAEKNIQRERAMLSHTNNNDDQQEDIHNAWNRWFGIPEVAQAFTAFQTSHNQYQEMTWFQKKFRQTSFLGKTSFENQKKLFSFSNTSFDRDLKISFIIYCYGCAYGIPKCIHKSKHHLLYQKVIETLSTHGPCQNKFLGSNPLLQINQDIESLCKIININYKQTPFIQNMLKKLIPTTITTKTEILSANFIKEENFNFGAIISRTLPLSFLAKNNPHYFFQSRIVYPSKDIILPITLSAEKRRNNLGDSITFNIPANLEKFSKSTIEHLCLYEFIKMNVKQNLQENNQHLKNFLPNQRTINATTEILSLYFLKKSIDKQNSSLWYNVFLPEIEDYLESNTSLSTSQYYNLHCFFKIFSFRPISDPLENLLKKHYENISKKEPFFSEIIKNTFLPSSVIELLSIENMSQLNRHS